MHNKPIKQDYYLRFGTYWFGCGGKIIDVQNAIFQASHSFELGSKGVRAEALSGDMQ
jgi:hypothetical protein